MMYAGSTSQANVSASAYLENMSINRDVDGTTAGALATGAPAAAALAAPGAPGTSPRTALDALDDLIGAVAATQSMMNSLMAWRAALIEAVRTWSLTSAGLLVDDSWAPRAEHTAHLAVVAELACALSLPERTTSSLVDDSQVLIQTCPATLAALRQGTISYRHAQVIMEHTDGLDPTQREDLERRLLVQAPGLTASTFARRARRERERSHPIPLAERHAKVLPTRCVEIEPARDGMAWLHQFLPAAEAIAIFNRVSDAAASLQHPSDPRTLPELRADTFSALMLDDEAHDAFRRAGATEQGCESGTGSEDGCDTSTGVEEHVDGTQSRAAGTSSLDGGNRLRGIRPTVAVTVPVLTLLGLSDSPGELEGYGPIDAETARVLAGQAPSFRRILTHPETGAVLSVGRDRYAVPADLKAVVRLRDETCRFPGCSRRARRCDIDHVTDWARGGETEQDNLMLLCRRHHRLKHLSRWQPRMTFHSARPDGTAPAATAANPPAAAEGIGTTGSPPPGLHPSGQLLPGHQSTESQPAGSFEGVVDWTSPSGRVYSTGPSPAARAPQFGYAFLLSLGLTEDFLRRLGITPTPQDADSPWLTGRGSRSRGDSAARGFADTPPF